MTLAEVTKHITAAYDEENSDLLESIIADLANDGLTDDELKIASTFANLALDAVLKMEGRF